MGLKVSNEKEKQGEGGRKPRQVSPEAAARSAEAGRRNLAAYNARLGRAGRPTEHGIAALLATGKLPPDSAPAIARADELIAKAIAELGGEAKLTAKQAQILEAQRLVLLVLSLGQDYVRRMGLLGRRGRPAPVLATLISFINAARLNAEMLGLGDARPAPRTIDEILAEEPNAETAK